MVAVWDEYVSRGLAAALESLTAQGGATPIVVVDNASTVPAIVPDGEPRITVIRSGRRLTLGAARNLGLAAVTTPNVIVWDADDTMLPGTLAFLEDNIARDPRLTAFGAAIIEDPAGHRHRWPRRWIARLVTRPRLFATLDCVWSLYPTTGATIMDMASVRAAGGYSDIESAEDWGLGVALAFRGRIGWSERPGRVYHLHHRSVWARHHSVSHQLAHARSVRTRLRDDRDVPRWVRTGLPLIAVAQSAAIAGHVAVASVRRRSDAARAAGPRG